MKVIDFGISKPLYDDLDDALADLTTSGQIMGSPRYMSPEQVRGVDVDMRADVWALGVILYELLTGTSPFAAATVADTLVRIVSQAARPVSELAPAAGARLASVVALCLAKEPALRPQTVNVLLEELDVHTKPGPILASRPGASFPPAPSVTTTLVPERPEGRRIRRFAMPAGRAVLAVASPMALLGVLALAAPSAVETSGGTRVAARAVARTHTGELLEKRAAAPLASESAEGPEPAPSLALAHKDMPQAHRFASTAAKTAPTDASTRPPESFTSGDDDLELERRQ